MSTENESRRLKGIHTDRENISRASMTPEEMVVAYRNRGYGYLTIGKKLNLEAIRLKNDQHTYDGIRVGERFKKGSQLAYKLHAEGRHMRY